MLSVELLGLLTIYHLKKYFCFYSKKVKCSGRFNSGACSKNENKEGTYFDLGSFLSEPYNFSKLPKTILAFFFVDFLFFRFCFSIFGTRSLPNMLPSEEFARFPIFSIISSFAFVLWTTILEIMGKASR